MHTRQELVNLMADKWLITASQVVEAMDAVLNPHLRMFSDEDISALDYYISRSS